MSLQANPFTQQCLSGLAGTVTCQCGPGSEPCLVCPAQPPSHLSTLANQRPLQFHICILGTSPTFLCIQLKPLQLPSSGLESPLAASFTRALMALLG